MKLADEYGYTAHFPTQPQPELRRVGSWLLVRNDIIARPVFSIFKPYTDFFGGYVAGARVAWPEVGDINVFSIHASPRPVPPEHLDHWPSTRPAERFATEGTLRQLHYVDLTLAMLEAVSAVGPVLAVGDLNEARDRDVHTRGGFTDDRTFGRQFFDRAAEGGFVDITFREWGEERQTLFKTGLPPYQSDRILATADIAPHVTSPIIDKRWADPELRKWESDHAPIWFKVAI